MSSNQSLLTPLATDVPSEAQFVGYLRAHSAMQECLTLISVTSVSYALRAWTDGEQVTEVLTHVRAQLALLPIQFSNETEVFAGCVQLHSLMVMLLQSFADHDLASYIICVQGGGLFLESLRHMHEAASHLPSLTSTDDLTEPLSVSGHSIDEPKEWFEEFSNEAQQRKVQLQAASEIVAQRQREALVLSEYAVLHSEIEKRIELRQQLLLGLFVVAGTLLSLGVGNVVSGEITLIYPLIALFIAQAWAHNDRKIGDIGTYIFFEVEEKYHFSGWETHRKRLHVASHQGKQVWAITPRMVAALNPLVLSTRGIFLTSQLLALGIGLVRSFPTMTTMWAWFFVPALTLIDVGATAMTWFVIEHQRDKEESPLPALVTPATTSDTRQLTKTLKGRAT